MSTTEPNPEPGRDRFLIGILIGILLLVIITLVLALNGRGELTYRPGTEPEDIAANYFVALSLKEYPQAYSYLWPDLHGFPTDAGRFFDEVQQFNRWDCRPLAEEESTNHSVKEVERFENRAVVTLEERVYSNDRSLFGGGGSYERNFTVRLIETPSGWRITESDMCWNREWSEPTVG